MDIVHHANIALNANVISNAQAPQLPSLNISPSDNMEVNYTSQEEQHEHSSKPQHDHFDHRGFTTGQPSSLMVGSLPL